MLHLPGSISPTYPQIMNLIFLYQSKGGHVTVGGKPLNTKQDITPSLNLNRISLPYFFIYILRTRSPSVFLLKRGLLQTWYVTNHKHSKAPPDPLLNLYSLYAIPTPPYVLIQLIYASGRDQITSVSWQALIQGNGAFLSMASMLK